MNVLVTGGTGYIGSHTTVELIARGFNPILVDNLSNSREDVVHAIEKIAGRPVDFYNIDLCDREALSNLLDSIKIDAVIHFAALKAVGESVQEPLKYYRNNLLSLINLLDEMRIRKISDFVFSSSCTVYGDTDQSPVNESMSTGSASSPYGQTKIIGENMLRDVARTSALKCVSLRYFNPAGAHESALIGENPLDTPNNLVPILTRVASGRIPRLTIFCKDYPTPDGTCIRDYIHVTDVAKAHVSALEFLNKSQPSSFEVFNLGSGNGSSVLEVINAFEKSTGRKLTYEFGPRRSGDVTQIWADPSRANNSLGWTARLSLEDMMRSAWEWEKIQHVSHSV